MKRFKSTGSNQIFLLPPSLDELVPKDSLARLVSEIVEMLDLELLYRRYCRDGRPAYHPKMLVKILFYAYSNGITSSRKIAQRLEQDTHFMFLSAMEHPDFRTISDFRKNNLDLLGEFFKQIVLICVQLGMVSVGHISIDGSKIKASAAKKNTKDANQLQLEIEKLEQEISALFAEAETNDQDEDKKFGHQNRGDEIPQQVQDCLKRKQKLEQAKQLLEQRGLTKINLTDPDSKFMKTPTHLEVCYNAQLAVDSDNQIIVANDVTVDALDSRQFTPLYEQSVTNVGKAPDEVSTDCGYANHKNYKYIQNNNIDAYVPPDRNALKDETDEDPSKNYSKEKFSYCADKDIYICPESRELHFVQFKKHRGCLIRVYRCTNCSGCPAIELCQDKKNKSKRRMLHIYETDDFIAHMRNKLKTEVGKQKYKKRLVTVEPVFGNLKYNLGFQEFSLRGHEKVRGEFNLMSIAHNLRKIHVYKLNQSLEINLDLLSYQLFIILVQIYFVSISKIKIWAIRVFGQPVYYSSN